MATGHILIVSFLFNFADLTARLSWINWENLGVSPARRGLLSADTT